MKIAIVGAGAIGGYLGVRLDASGQEISFIARGPNLQAIRERGMKLVLEDGRQLSTARARAYEKLADAGPHDVVLLTLKAHQVGAIAPDLHFLMHPETTVVTMQNGIPWWYFHRHGGQYDGRAIESADPGGIIASYLDASRVIGSVVYPAAELVSPGVVRLIEGNRFSLGTPDRLDHPRAQAVSDALTGAGFKAPLVRDIRNEIWLKVWGNLSFNPISALTHATLVDMCEFPPSRLLIEQMMLETKTIGEKLGVIFKISIEKRIAGAQAVGAHKTSMLQDVELGRPIEIDALMGPVIELGRLTQTPTPCLEAVYACTCLLEKTLRNQHGRLRISVPD